MNSIPARDIFNRDLSWIEFNRRVLAESMDETNPLLERLKFAGIVSSNFDEFFMVRVSGLNEYEPIYQETYSKAFGVLNDLNDYFRAKMVPQLKEVGIVRVYPQEITEKQFEYLNHLFQKELTSLLTPIAFRQESPVPVLTNLSLYALFRLVDPLKPEIQHYAVIEIPKNFPRLITVPSEARYAFVLLEDVISIFAKQLFPGYEIIDQGLVRISRAAELSFDEEKDEDFAEVMVQALRLRRKSEIVRLEYAASDALVNFLKATFRIPDHKLYRVSSWFDLKTISQLAFQPMFDDLKKLPWIPVRSELEKTDNIWLLLQKRDVTVLHPYESFGAFTRFIWEAARDSDVLAIKQTLYRAGEHSAVVDALETAAINGKQVTVLIELKARFDEERNINFSQRLQQAGATVLYGVTGLKTHAKACLVVRREAEGVRRYLHLSTGNYNEKTAAVYSDVSYFTVNENLARDISGFFNLITGLSYPTGFSEIEISPYYLKKRLLRMILRESLRSAKDGLIIAKMNSLVDPDIIKALYQASQKGVQIKLNVRGICCLKPGVKDLSENIEVISVVDMFLEHSRMFYFYNNGEDELYLSSADWMPRNLESRLEIMFPVKDPKNKRYLTELLKFYFEDNVKSWKLLPDGQYQRQQSKTGKRFRVQEFLCHRFMEQEIMAKSPTLELKPQKPKIHHVAGFPSP